MITLKRLLSLELLLLVLIGHTADGQGREEVPSILESNKIAAHQSPDADRDPPKVAVVIRIPKSAIAKAFNRDFQNSEHVQREILGTKSQGQAKCHGTVTCGLEENPSGAAFCCRIEGTVSSETCGTNGPAIIHSTAKTTYVAFKRFAFNGTRFVSSPVTLSLKTELQITGIDSTLPALRGRIVRRVASQRALQSHAQAQEITTSITREELGNRIDKEFDTRLNDLNHKLASRLTLIENFRAAGNEIFIRSFNDSVEIGLLTAPLTRNDVAIHKVPMGETIELWIGTGGVEASKDKTLTSMPAITTLIGQAPHWLATYFSKSPQLSKLDEKTLQIKRHEEWIVIQLLD